jgi:hypothetical protein
VRPGLTDKRSSGPTASLAARPSVLDVSSTKVIDRLRPEEPRSFHWSAQCTQPKGVPPARSSRRPPWLWRVIKSANGMMTTPQRRLDHDRAHSPQYGRSHKTLTASEPRKSLGISRQRGTPLSDLEALEYWHLHQIQEDREGDGRSKRAGDDRCRQRRHGNAANR